MRDYGLQSSGAIGVDGTVYCLNHGFFADSADDADFGVFVYRTPLVMCGVFLDMFVMADVLMGLFILNAHRIWSSTPQISDFHGFGGWRGFWVFCVFDAFRQVLGFGRRYFRSLDFVKSYSPLSASRTTSDLKLRGEVSAFGHRILLSMG